MSRWWGTILPSSPPEAAFDAEHARDAEAPDVGVEHADRWPRAASAAARFTVTELLPTPPLPLDTAITRVVAGISVSGAFSRALQSGRCIAAELLLRGHLDPADLHVLDPGKPGDLRLDLAADLGLERTPERGRARPGP